MKKNILLFSIIFLSLLSCTQSNRQTLAEKELVLESLYSFQLESPEIIGKIHDHHGIKVNSTGERLLFADMSKNKVLITDSLGKVEALVGGNGRGPAEFLEINGLGFIDDSTFFVYDESLALIKKFHVNGNLVGSFVPSMEGYYFSSLDFIVNDSTIFAVIIETEYLRFLQENDYEQMAKSKIIGAIDTSGNDTGMYGAYDKLTAESMDYVQFSVMEYSKGWGKIFINQLNSPIVQYFIPETEEFGVFSEQVPQNYMPGKEFMTARISINKMKEMSLGRTYAERLVPLENHLFKSMDKLTEEWNITQDDLTKTNILVVYDKGGNIVAEKVLEGKRLFGGHGNKLYFLTDNNPDNFTIQVATYRLIDK